MALFSDLSSVQSLLPSTLSFTIGDLQVLMDALYAFRDKVVQDDDDPNKPCYAVEDGRDYFQVVNELLEKFNHYSFK